MTSKQSTFGGNRLLNFLPEKTRTQFIKRCAMVNLNLGDVVDNHGDTIHYIYFPVAGVISWEMKITGSPYLVVTLIGNEGMLCAGLILGINITPCRAVVQKAGFALRIEALDFIQQIEHNHELDLLLKRYVFVTYNQLLQTAACNLFHVLESRLAKLIMMLKDRSQSDELHITQEHLAQMLGVRRVGVTKAAGSLQRKNLISYSRGAMMINNAKGLKAVSCLCYQADKETYEQFLHTQIFKSEQFTMNINENNHKKVSHN